MATQPDRYAALSKRLGKPLTEEEKGRFDRLVMEMVWEWLLLDLANARRPQEFWEGPSAFPGLWRMLFDKKYGNAKIAKFAEQVRALWGAGTPQSKRFTIVRGWLNAAGELPRIESRERLVKAPSVGSLPLQLAGAALRLGGRLAFCANPECNCRFVKEREYQRYCGRPECADYASSKYLHDYYKRTLKPRRAKAAAAATA